MDIVERLRRTELHHVWDDLEGKMVGKMFSANPDGPEAADEIELLREALTWIERHPVEESKQWEVAVKEMKRLARSALPQKESD